MNMSLGLQNIARQDTHSPAISFEGRQLTYGALEHQAASIAGSLVGKRGLVAGDRVAVVMGNVLEYLPALYGIWRAGLCAVPIDANLEAREVARIIDDCDAKLMIATRTVVDRFSGLAGHIWPSVLVAGSRDWMAMLFADPITAPPVGSEANAWIVYRTSTAGQPKGAVISHRQLQFMVAAYYADIDQLDARDCMVSAAPLNDGAGLYALAHVARGSHQIIFPTFQADRILATVASRENVSMLATPPMLAELMKNAATGQFDLSGLKTIIVDGPIAVGEIKRALAIFGPRLYHLYGRAEAPMTITGVSKSLFSDSTHSDYEARLASVGLPRSGVAVKIVGDNGQELPAGQTGKIIMSSDGVMSGYWTHPGVPAPALSDRWFCTGDAGLLDNHGFLTLKQGG